MTRVRPRAEWLWAALVLAYGALRVLLVVVVFNKYGVNPYLFAAVEMSSSAVYGLSSGRLVTSLLAHDNAGVRRWGPPSFAGFIAPDLLVVATARRVPVTIYVAFGLVVLTTSIVTVRTLRRKTS